MSKIRIDEIKKNLVKENLDGLIVTHADFIRYLTGFTGSAGILVITAKTADFITDFRYKDQASKQVKGAKVLIHTGDYIAALKDSPKLNKQNMRLGFSGSFITVAELNNLKSNFPKALFVDADTLTNELGWVKDKDELASITKAVEISDLAFERILNMVAPGIRESELGAELEYQMRMLGSERPAFETIIASGYRSALPHGLASKKKIKKGEFITFDFGATYNGYVSDMTRTIVVGKATTRQKKIYNLVLKSQKAGIRKIKAGVSGKAVDNTCRKIITNAGYGKNFGHGTGHGIGFFVHVGPRLSGLSEDKLKAGNVVTVEPGIYISGWGGVRIEDDVVVTKNGGKVLNISPKNLLEV